MLLLILVHIVLYVRGVLRYIGLCWSVPSSWTALPGCPFERHGGEEVIGTIWGATQYVFEVVWTVPVNHGDAYQHNHRLHLNPSHIMINPFSGETWYILQCLYSYCESIWTLNRSWNPLYCSIFEKIPLLTLAFNVHEN